MEVTHLTNSGALFTTVLHSLSAIVWEVRGPSSGALVKECCPCLAWVVFSILRCTERFPKSVLQRHFDPLRCSFNALLCY